MVCTSRIFITIDTSGRERVRYLEILSHESLQCEFVRHRNVDNIPQKCNIMAEETRKPFTTHNSQGSKGICSSPALL